MGASVQDSGHFLLPGLKTAGSSGRLGCAARKHRGKGNFHAQPRVAALCPEGRADPCDAPACWAGLALLPAGRPAALRPARLRLHQTHDGSEREEQPDQSKAREFARDLPFSTLHLSTAPAQTQKSHRCHSFTARPELQRGLALGYAGQTVTLSIPSSRPAQQREAASRSFKALITTAIAGGELVKPLETLYCYSTLQRSHCSWLFLSRRHSTICLVQGLEQKVDGNLLSNLPISVQQTAQHCLHRAEGCINLSGASPTACLGYESSAKLETQTGLWAGGHGG